VSPFRRVMLSYGHLLLAWMLIIIGIVVFVENRA
jgi:hypothetical protein